MCCVKLATAIEILLLRRSVSIVVSVFVLHGLDFSYIISLVFFISFMFVSDEGPTLETLVFTIRIGCSTPTFSYFDHDHIP